MAHSKVQLQDLFKISILSVQLDLDIKSLETFCLKHQICNDGRIKSNMGGYQSHNLDGEDKDLKPLEEEIKKYCRVMAEEHTLEQEFRSMEMWLNINGYKDYNLPHNHPASVFSGVYYIKTPPNCGNIVFDHPGLDVMAYAHSNLKFKEFNSRTAATWWQTPVENTMFIFPSWLKHCVEPNLSKDIRISISFNCCGLI